MNTNAVNILKWYPFEKNSKILEIYDKNSILENINKKIKLKKCPVADFKIDEKYDYITLIGTYEYAPKIVSKPNPYVEILKRAKEHLNSNGKILLAIDNRLGIKYFAGASSEHYTQIFGGIQQNLSNNQTSLLTKNEIVESIKKAGFKNFKFYYPVPNYKDVSAIFTDNFLPTSNQSKINYPVEYNEKSIIVYNEINVIKQICDMNEFANFTNSYLVEISNEQIDNDIKFIQYNNFRKNKYRLMLIMKENEIEKIPETDTAIKHIDDINKYIVDLKGMGFQIAEDVKDRKILSKYIKSEELDNRIVNKIIDKDINGAYEEIDKWYSYIKEKLIKDEVESDDIFVRYKIDVPQDIKNKMKFIKKGYIDLSFENVFCSEEYLFYDQEWFYENIPIEFILYRAINNMYIYNCDKLEKKLSKEAIFSKFNLNEFIEFFNKLELKIQNEILDENLILKYNERNNKLYKSIEELKQSEEENKARIIENNKLIQEKINLEKRYNSLQEQNIKMENKLKEEKREIEAKYNELLMEYNTSRGWKIIKCIRKILIKLKIRKG